MRHNLLIVDDEALIRQGLRARLTYLQIDVDEILEADDGTQALHIVRTHPVDIVITDIKMPDMDGLTLIEEIRRTGKEDIQFIVLSGYAEFSYAETAIRLGVKAYLLKPLSNDEIRDTFDKLYREMEDNGRVRSALLSQQRLRRQQQEYLLEKEVGAFFADPAGALASPERLKLLLAQTLSIRLRENACIYLAEIGVDQESYQDSGFGQKDHELIRFSVRNVFYEIESSCEKLIVNGMSDSNILYAVFLGGEEKRLRNEIERIFLKMRSVLEKKMAIYLTFGVSRPAREFLPQSASQAHSALQQRIVYGNSNLYFFEDMKIMSQQEFPSSQMHLIDQYIRKNEVYKLKALLDEIFSEELIRRHGTAYLRIMWVRILNILFHHYDQQAGTGAGLEKLLSNFNLPDHINSLSEIRQQVTEMILECIRADHAPEANARSKMQLAIRYIQEHYNENISVNDLAEQYNMSPNYFSSVFKKEMGSSPVSYITQLRMKKSMELLERSDLSVVDIARKVGYDEGQYFFRVFKKYTGMTPLNYREGRR